MQHNARIRRTGRMLVRSPIRLMEMNLNVPRDFLASDHEPRPIKIGTTQ